MISIIPNNRMAELFVVFLLAIAGQSLGESVTDGTKLVSTFMINRHGDRTPTESSLVFSVDKEDVKLASAKYGYGQLTDLGKQRAYDLGKFIRSRYNELLSQQYNKSEIYIRSTDSTRTKMTSLTTNAALFPASPRGSWSKEINWEPTPYTNVPAKYDINMAFVNCPTFISAYNSLMLSDSGRMSKYFDELNTVSEVIGINITSVPVTIYAVYDAFVAQQHLEVPLGYTINAIMPKINDAADVAIDVLCGDETYSKYLAGPLLNEFFTYTTKQMNGTDTPPVRIYSAHDVNVYALMAVSQITPRQGVPKYAACYAMELRQVIETGKYVVLLVYLSQPGEEVKYLQVKGCDNLLCPYDTFKEIVSPYIMDEDTWRTKCGFTKDLEIDYSNVA